MPENKLAKSNIHQKGTATMSSTALQDKPQVPGWYIEFQTAVLRQLPRPGEIDMNQANFWSSKQRCLRLNLQVCLVKSPISAYDRVEQTLRNLLTGQKLPFPILCAGEMDPIVQIGQKITNTHIKTIIEKRHHLGFAGSHYSLIQGIRDELEFYDRQLMLVAPK